MSLLDRLRTNLRQVSSLSCTSVVSWTCCPADFLRKCCTHVNIPLDPAIAGVMFFIIPRSLQHLRREVVRVSLGMINSAATTFSCLLGGRRIRWAILSRSYPRTVFRVDHTPSLCPSFFTEMESFPLVSTSLLGLITRSVLWKRCRSIWHPPLGPPWMTEIKFSDRY